MAEPSGNGQRLVYTSHSQCPHGQDVSIKIDVDPTLAEAQPSWHPAESIRVFLPVCSHDDFKHPVSDAE